MKKYQVMIPDEFYTNTQPERWVYIATPDMSRFKVEAHDGNLSKLTD